MKIEIKFCMDNAAFKSCEGIDEVTRILEDLKDLIIEHGMKKMIIRDINGNSVGYMEMRE